MGQNRLTWVRVCLLGPLGTGVLSWFESEAPFGPGLGVVFNTHPTFVEREGAETRDTRKLETSVTGVDIFRHF